MTLFKYISFKINRIGTFLRMLRFYYFFKSSDIILLKNVTCRFKPKSIKTGQHLKILQNCIFEFNSTANIQIGNDCIFSYGSVLALQGNFTMGNNVMVGEYTSIRDASHDYTVNEIPMTQSKDTVKDITIGNNVWIGRGCIIMPGTLIEDGVVIGANSVVKGQLIKDGIYAGSPAKFIKKRDPSILQTQ